jgi:Na+/proline symporter
MPTIISILLVLGVLAATFSATGGALTSLTTSFAVDVLRNKDISTASRKWIHATMALVLGLLVLAFEQWSSDSTINLVYRLASYTYGPLLGLFAFGVLSKRAVRDRVVPAVVLLAPLFSLVLDLNSEAWFGGYNFGFELLLVNATFTIVGLYLSSLRISANSLS